MFTDYADSYYDDTPAYEWPDHNDDYPHRSEATDEAERTIQQYCDADAREISEALYGGMPILTVKSAEELRELLNMLVPEPPEGYAYCCHCDELTPLSSKSCYYCCEEYLAF